MSSEIIETDATVVMVDRRHRPGGHWNDAYSFVKLHGPSALYGVASQKLERPVKETVDFTGGEDELASQAEIMDYWDCPEVGGLRRLCPLKA